MSRVLDRVADNRRDLCCSGDPRREKSKLAFAFEPRAKFGLLAPKTLDAIYDVAGKIVR